MPLNSSMGMGRSKLNVQLALPEGSTFDVKCMGNQRCKEIFSALKFFFLGSIHLVLQLRGGNATAPVVSPLAIKTPGDITCATRKKLKRKLLLKVRLNESGDIPQGSFVLRLLSDYNI